MEYLKFFVPFFVAIFALYWFYRLGISDKNLQHERDKLAVIIASMTEGIFVVDKVARIFLINKAASQFCHVSPEKAIGQPFDMIMALWHGGKKIAMEDVLFEKLGRTEVSFIADVKDDYFLQSRYGKKFPVAFVISPVKDGIQGAVIVFRDITKEKTFEDARANFISFASHQLRAPLTNIRWTSELLQKESNGSFSSEQKHLVENLSSSTLRMTRLIDALLNMARIESGQLRIQPESIDVEKLYCDVMNDLTQSLDGKKDSFIFKKDPTVSTVETDPKFLSEILKNLLSNAAKYTSPKGIIEVEISIKNNDVFFRVTDNGIGIPAEQQSRIFEKFFQADNAVSQSSHGNGLGMYIAKSLVELLGGKIWFESKEGQGTSFYFTLPLDGIPAQEGTKVLE